MTLPISERDDVAGPIVSMLRDDPFNTAIAQERPVVIDGQARPIDILARHVTPERISVIAIECKTSLAQDVVEQAISVLSKSNQTFVGVAEPSNQSKVHRIRRGQLATLGIGLLYVQRVGEGHTVTQVMAAKWEARDTRILEAAIRAHDGSLDPAAGSAAATRQTPARTQWEPLREYLARDGMGRETWAYIKRYVPEMRRYTSARVRKAIDAGECLGVEYDDRAIPTLFYIGGKR